LLFFERLFCERLFSAEDAWDLGSRGSARFRDFLFRLLKNLRRRASRRSLGSLVSRRTRRRGALDYGYELWPDALNVYAEVLHIISVIYILEYHNTPIDYSILKVYADV
jgi:hypothetical protein